MISTQDAEILLVLNNLSNNAFEAIISDTNETFKALRMKINTPMTHKPTNP